MLIIGVGPHIIPLWRDNQPLINVSYLPFDPPSKKQETTMKALWEALEEGIEGLYLSSIFTSDSVFTFF
jgi:hypothetical protein